MERSKVKLVLEPGHAVVNVDGVEIADRVRSLSLSAAVGDMPRLKVEYLCRRIEVDGEYEIEHVCNWTTGPAL